MPVLENDPRVAELLGAFCHLIHLASALGAPPDTETTEEKYYNRTDAARFLTVSVSSFDRHRKDRLIKPSHTIGSRGHRYAEADLIKLRQHLFKEQ